jgi:hypothetical protein
MALLTLKSDLPLNSTLQLQLADMVLFNYLCGEDNITADIDYKNILRRLQNTLLHLKCMTLNGIVLTPQLIKSHLLKASLKEKCRINAPLSPKDKQDVKLMYDLLTSIATLPSVAVAVAVGRLQLKPVSSYS